MRDANYLIEFTDGSFIVTDEGSGESLSEEDYNEGYRSYVNYSCSNGDGGLFYFKNHYSDISNSEFLKEFERIKNNPTVSMTPITVDEYMEISEGIEKVYNLRRIIHRRNEKSK